MRDKALFPDRTKKMRARAFSPFFTRQFVSLFIIIFLMSCTKHIYILTLPAYAEGLGASFQALGLLSGIFYICALSVRPVSGQVVDYENKKTALRCVLLAMLVSALGLSMANQYELLVVFRGINGLSWGIATTLCMTLAANCFSSHNMATGIGIYTLAQTVAQIVTPLFALPTAEAYGYNILYGGTIIVIFTCIGLTFFLQPEISQPGKRRYTLQWRSMIHITALLPAFLTACNYIARASVTAFLVVYAGTMDIGNIGIYFTIQAITIVLCRPLIVKMADRFGSLKLLLPCEMLGICGLVMVALSHSLSIFLLAAVFMGISIAGEQPILMAESIKTADASTWGRASNTTYIGADIGYFIGSGLAGVLVAHIGYRNMYLASTLPIALCAIIIVVMIKRDKG